MSIIRGFEPLQYNRQVISESVNDRSPIKLRSILQRADTKNQNGRIYPRAILEREMNNYMEFIKNRSAMGELDHSDSSVVNLKNVSHALIEAHWEGNDVVGTIEILTTPSGNILRELLLNNIRLGVSSRGLGSVLENADGDTEVDEDFSLLCYDIVSSPSTHGAFLNESINHEMESKFSKINSLVIDFLTEIR